MSLTSRCCSASTSAATSACAGVMVRSLGDDPRQRAAMQQIADWLEKLGMSEYAQRFAQNDVDISVLPHLSDNDLKELGVSLGHRRKMLAAIAKLDETLAAVAPAPPPQSQPQVASAVPPMPEAAGERRHVTVMFCDLVDST